MVNYALKLNTVPNYLDKPMRKDETVIYISRHFGSEISGIVELHDIKSISQFISYLSRTRGNLNK